MAFSELAAFGTGMAAVVRVVACRLPVSKPVFISREVRDRLDRIVRCLGDRGMSVSGLVENLARQHLAAYGNDIDQWRKL